MKIGLGFDVHRLVKGRKLILGGVEIPCQLGLLGHSDADVVLHALADAIAGALGADDIGTIFPNSNPEFKDISSKKILAYYTLLLAEKKMKITNLDMVILAERPKLSPFYSTIRKELAHLLSIDTESIGIKAKTAEGLGMIGEEKAIACWVTLLLDSI
ncbi:MAG: 2-C-methyl-D-erythritol 2,4-cyclodiphosphate synthase [Candidatus Ratteibacteria bacterium]|jgi:2-C-methyl-D-erythritol 2,4-cyclodiphosphate synthase